MVDVLELQFSSFQDGKMLELSD